MTDWSDLQRELDRWGAAGRIATFWWRDDDATAPSPALDRLLALARDQQVVPLLAVIPAHASSALAQRLAHEPVGVAQHGYAHANHAWPMQKKAELGPHRPIDYMLGELARGGLAMDRLFGPDWMRVLVPPHNRIAPALVDALPGAGYVGLSVYQARRRKPVPNFVETNAHVDLMEWLFTQAFVGEHAALTLAIRHLAARREGRCDPDEPTGLLTHHLAHDEGAWNFAAAFIGRVKTHGAAQWLEPPLAFASPRRIMQAAQ